MIQFLFLTKSDISFKTGHVVHNDKRIKLISSQIIDGELQLIDIQPEANQ